MLHSVNNLEIKKPERRYLRKHQTSAEAKLWSLLRNRQLAGHKFYRQFSVGKFVLDFYCHERKLAIELDGEQHKQKREYDMSRTIYLENNGIAVLRFWNGDVLNHPDDVCKRILQYLI